MSQTKPPGSTSINTEAPADIPALEAELDQTRNAITGDLRTLGARLSPEKLKEDAKEVMTDAKNAAVETLNEAKNIATSTYREVKSDAMNTVSAKVDEIKEDVRIVERQAVGFVRENAVPLALMGVGLAWLLSNRKRTEQHWQGRYAPRGSGRWQYPETEGAHPLDDARGGISRAAEATREYGARAKDRARGWVEDAERGMSQAAGEVKDFAEREASQVKGAVRDASQKLERATQEARLTASRELRHAWDYSRDTVEAHPLAVAAGVVAAGVCVGLAIPETRRENELLGAQRERLFGDAKDAVGELTQAAKKTAREVESSLTGTAG